MLTKLNDPELRLFGVDHVAVAWLDKDTEWTSEKGRQNNNLASNTVPLLDRAAPPAGEGGGEARRQAGGGSGAAAGADGRHDERHGPARSRADGHAEAT